MKRIELEYRHDRLVLRVGTEEYYIPAEQVLELADRQRVKDRFEVLDPERVYGEWETPEFIGKITVLEGRGLLVDEIAEYLGVSGDLLKKWLVERASMIRRIKEGPTFESLVRALDERMPKKSEVQK